MTATTDLAPMPELDVRSRSSDDIAREGLALAERADAIAITSDQTFAEAGDFLKLVKTYQQRVHDVLDPVVEAAHKAHKVAVEQRKALLSHAERAEAALKQRMATYHEEQERRRREAEFRAQQERERLEAEAKERAEADAARLRAEAEAVRLEQAVAAEAAGDTEAAERLLAEPVVVAPVLPTPVFVPPVTVSAPKVDGVSFREEWDFQVTNEAAIPREYLKVDEVKLRRVVKAMRGATTIPGVRVFARQVAAVRA